MLPTQLSTCMWISIDIGPRKEITVMKPLPLATYLARLDDPREASHLMPQEPKGYGQLYNIHLQLCQIMFLLHFLSRSRWKFLYFCGS